MRYAMTRVLPDPAPARISNGPSVWRTASRCSGLRSETNEGLLVTGGWRVVTEDADSIQACTVYGVRSYGQDGVRWTHGERTAACRTHGERTAARRTWQRSTRAQHVTPGPGARAPRHWAPEHAHPALEQAHPAPGTGHPAPLYSTVTLFARFRG